MVKLVYDLNLEIVLKKKSQLEAEAVVWEKYPWLSKEAQAKLWYFGSWCFSKG